MTVASKRAPRSAAGLSDRALAGLLLLAPALVLLVLVAYPSALAVLSSLFHVDFVTGARRSPGGANYLTVFTDPAIRAATWRTIAWSVGNLAIQVVAGVACALVLNAGLRGQTLARGLVLFPYMVPAVVATLIFRYLFNDVTGLVNYLSQQVGLIDQPVNFLGDPDTVLPTLILVNCWKYTPFITLIVLARLQTVPRSLYDAARLDGAGRLALFRSITLPWIAPSLLAAALLRTIWTAYDFDLPYLLAYGGPVDASTTLAIQIRKVAFDQQDIGLASALSVCFAILLVAAAVPYVRSFRRSEQWMR
ncbi:hypothetical protein GCM10009555_101600 [Acrocarpospora macrocephala]|uniref:ABC transmembrane type-1 domain-containing protein n=1 Tax=Acrocarpospora macrocephala TaxID=150177 RepID=A0A5M3WDR5_9ACTN|nr:sugar ABC transporter permease [Acrocarpospora macrocephala]GES07084.1 hypothetical protein Amac_006790 [Acrocarpospora macrocephala]